MNTQPLVFIPAWLARVNTVRKLIPQDSMFGEFDYKRACSLQVARIRLFVVRQVATGKFSFLSTSTPAACAPTLSAQPVASDLAQAGYYFVPGVGVVNDFDRSYDPYPAKGQTSALLNQLSYRLGWLMLPCVALLLFLSSLSF